MSKEITPAGEKNVAMRPAAKALLTAALVLCPILSIIARIRRNREERGGQE